MMLTFIKSSESTLDRADISCNNVYLIRRVWIHEKFLATYRQFKISAPEHNGFINKHNIYSAVFFC
jgi:hypothetical protein